MEEQRSASFLRLCRDLRTSSSLELVLTWPLSASGCLSTKSLTRDTGKAKMSRKHNDAILDNKVCRFRRDLFNCFNSYCLRKIIAELKRYIKKHLDS